VVVARERVPESSSQNRPQDGHSRPSSRGRFWTDGQPNSSMNGEIGVFSSAYHREELSAPLSSRPVFRLVRVNGSLSPASIPRRS